MRYLQHLLEVRHHASSLTPSPHHHWSRNAAPRLHRGLLRPLAMEILHRLEAKQAAERQDGLERQEGRSSKETPRPNEP